VRTDNLSRGLLAAILVVLVLLIVEHRDTSDGAREPAHAIDRFDVRPIAMRRGPPLLLRIDTATGEAWTMGLMAAPVWERLEEAADGVPEPDAIVPGRFSIHAHKQTRGLPTLVRLDTVTGRVWRKGSMTPRPWVAVPNPEFEPQASAAPIAAPDPAAGLMIEDTDASNEPADAPGVDADAPDPEAIDEFDEDA
jgi:hypothetical protein